MSSSVPVGVAPVSAVGQASVIVVAPKETAETELTSLAELDSERRQEPQPQLPAEEQQPPALEPVPTALAPDPVEQVLAPTAHSRSDGRGPADAVAAAPARGGARSSRVVPGDATGQATSSGAGAGAAGEAEAQDTVPPLRKIPTVPILRKAGSERGMRKTLSWNDHHGKPLNNVSAGWAFRCGSRLHSSS